MGFRSRVIWWEDYYKRLKTVCPECNNRKYIFAIEVVFNIKNTLTDSHLALNSPLARHIISVYNKKQEEEAFCMACDLPMLAKE